MLHGHGYVKTDMTQHTETQNSKRT